MSASLEHQKRMLAHLEMKEARVAWCMSFHSQGDFAATNDAEKYLEDRGFSVGRMERGKPRGILLGNYDIQKWHNLESRDREALHGQLTGDGRNGPITITIFPNAPDDVHVAIRKVV